MNSTNKKNLACFSVVLAIIVLVTTYALPSQLEDQSQQGIQAIKQIEQQIEIYKD